MTKPKSTPLIGGDILGQLGDMFDTADKRLDQSKKYVEKEKEELEKLRASGNLESLAVNMYQAFENGIKADLSENGKTGDAQAPYLAVVKEAWKEKQMDKQAEVILSSPELSAMDDFIGHLENLPKLKELIETAEPQAKWQAMLAGLASGFPGLEKYLEGDLGKLLSSIGLGFLVPAKKGEKPEEGKTDEKKKGGKEAKEQDEGKKAESVSDGPLDGPEKVPEDFKPGKTLVLGDSHYEVFGADMNKNLREKMNATEIVAKGAMQSGWGIGQIEKKPADFFKDFENVVIGFGSNDLGSKDEAGAIWGRLRRMIGILREKNPKIKIIMATVPPAKGNQSGEWLTDFEGVEKKREELNMFIKEAQNRGLIQGVMDLAAKQKDGGLADDNDSSSMAESLRRPGDKVHATAGTIATAIRRAQYHARDAKVEVTTYKMADTQTQITTEELKKMLTESILSEELKTDFAAVLNDMTGEEKTELIQIIENGKKATAEAENERNGKLIKLNTALEKYLQKSLHEEEKYIREQFETAGKEEDKKEMENVETEVNNL